MATRVSARELLERLTLNSIQQPQPRPSPHRIDPPADHQLPPLDKVREDAAKFEELIPSWNDHDVDVVQLAIECNMPVLCNLVDWALYAQPTDTPEDLVEGCIFALKMSIYAVRKCDDDALRKVPRPPGEDFNRDFALLQTIGKAAPNLVYYLTTPTTDRPAEALPYLKLLADIDIRTSARTGPLPWIRNPSFYAGYATALALSGSTDTATKLMLERAIEGVKRDEAISSEVSSDKIVFLKLHLAHVYRCQNIQTAEAKENERYMIKFLRKHPELLDYAYLKQALIRPGQPERHILTALGGPEWLNRVGKQPFTMKFRADKKCFTCGVCEPQKTLFRCSGCQETWYCSKRCQASEWKTHRFSCRQMCREHEAREALRSSGSDDVRRRANWKTWRINSFGGNNNVPVHALGMQRDPSRGRTHIIFYDIEYTPRTSRGTKDKFRVDSVGVYRISDVIPEIEATLRMKPGEGKTHIETMLACVDLNSVRRDTERRLPSVYLVIGEGLFPALGSFSVCEKTLLKTPYDPNWRLSMNEGAPPKVMRLVRKGVQDAEHIFD